MELTYHGTVTDGTLRLDHEVELPSGTPVEVTVRPAAGSPKALFEALERLPKVSREDAEALLAAIEEGKLPSRNQDPFTGILEQDE